MFTAKEIADIFAPILNKHYKPKPKIGDTCPNHFPPKDARVTGGHCVALNEGEALIRPARKPIADFDRYAYNLNSTKAIPAFKKAKANKAARGKDLREKTLARADQRDIKDYPELNKLPERLSNELAKEMEKWYFLLKEAELHANPSPGEHRKVLISAHLDKAFCLALEAITPPGKAFLQQMYWKARWARSHSIESQLRALFELVELAKGEL